MITEILEKSIKRNNGFNNRGLSKVSNEVREDIKNDVGILREVTSIDEKRDLIESRRKFYDKGKIAEPCYARDPFDEEARFLVFECYKDNKKYVSKAFRLVNRNSLGVLPLELNLKSEQELKYFFSNNDSDVNYDVLNESTLDDVSKKSLLDLIGEYDESEKLYEIGGLFGYDNDPFNSLALILGIGQMGCQEEWDLVVQTNHPKHLGAYKIIGYPYRLIKDRKLITDPDSDLKIDKKGFLDYCQRCSQIVYLEGKEFRSKYMEIRRECSELY